MRTTHPTNSLRLKKLNDIIEKSVTTIAYWGSKSLRELFIKILKAFGSLFGAETGISVFVFSIRQNLTCINPKMNIISKSPFNPLLTSRQFSVFSCLTKTLHFSVNILSKCNCFKKVRKLIISRFYANYMFRKYTFNTFINLNKKIKHVL